MHVLFVAPYPPNAVRTRSRNLIKQMARHGHRVTAVVLSVGPTDGNPTAGHDSVELVTVTKSTLGAYLSSAGALVRNQSLEVAYCASSSWRQAVDDVIASGGVDLIHLEHIRATSVGAGLGLPTVFDAVDCRTTVWRRARDLGHGVRRLIGAVEAPRVRRQEKEALARYDRVLVSSVADRDALVEISPGVAPTVLRNGVDAEYFASVPPRPQPGTIVLSGAMSYQPNAEAAVQFCRDVLPLVRRRRSNAHLDIVGSSPGRGVRALAAADVAVTGFVEDLRPYLSRAQVAVCPTRLGAGSQYKVLEAMAAGVPVVASRAAAEAHGLQDGVHLITADGATQTADAVLELLGNETLADRLREAGLAEIQARFSWDLVGDELDRIHASLLATGR
jgi:glycosyltransferase involved in cell wall biosynthesis